MSRTGPALATHRVRLVLVGALLSGMALSPTLWLSRRDFPLAPLGDLIPPLPAPVDGLALGALALALVSTCVPRLARRATLAAVLLATLAVLQDQMRLQPWVYQDVLMLGLLGLAGTRAGATLDHDRALSCLRLIMAATYLWSGLHKLNLEFVERGFPWLVEPLLPAGGAAVTVAAWIVPVLEASFGVGLIWPRTRRPALVGAMGMHLFILSAIGPLGHDWNPVVWPWNLAMLVLLPLLFWRETRPPREALLAPGLLPRVLALVVLVAPAGHLAGRWDGYLSFALYSYSNPSAFVRLDAERFARLPPDLRGVEPDSEPGRMRVPLDAWSLATVGVPTYPAARVFLQVHRSLCSTPGGAPPPELVIHDRARFGGRRYRLYRCGETEPFQEL